MFKARLVPQGDPRWLGVLPVIGFAGIANPKKFYATLSQHGARLDRYLVLSRSSRAIASARPRRLLKWATRNNAMLVTTEKDWVRLPEDDGTALAS